MCINWGSFLLWADGGGHGWRPGKEVLPGRLAFWCLLFEGGLGQLLGSCSMWTVLLVPARLVVAA